MSINNKRWYLKAFDELTNRELYGILQLRTEVFVVEQTCIFQDMDGKDYDNCQHIFCKIEEKVIACSRIFPSGVTFKEASVGRICTSPAHRGSGLGKELMRRSLAEMDRLFPGASIRIGAQTYLNNFYKNFGFVNASELYMEDGIEHVEMVRPSN